MPKLRIATDIDSAPDLLRDVLQTLLTTLPEAEILPPGTDADAMITVTDTPEARPNAVNTRLILAIAPEGDRVVVHRATGGPETLHNADPQTLRAVLMQVAPHRSWLARLHAALHPAPAGPPAAPSQPPPAPGFRYLAAKALRTRGAHLQNVGPEGELLTMLSRLANPAESVPPPLLNLSSRFDLSPAAADLLLLATLAQNDPRAARMVALLNDHLDRPSPSLATMAALGHDPADLAEALGPSAPLRRFALVETGDDPLSTAPLTVPDCLRHALLLAPPPAPQPSHQDARTFTALAPLLDQDIDDWPSAVALLGPKDSGRQAMVEALARHLGCHAAPLPTEPHTSSADITSHLRDAAVLGRIPVLRLTDPLPDLNEALTGWPVPIVILLAPPSLFPAIARRVGPGVLDLHLPPRTAERRATEWLELLPQTWPPQVAHHLADRFDFGPRTTRHAIALATTRARADGRPAPLSADLRAACADLREADFEGAAEELPCPFAADDIVLPPATRAELDLAVAWAGHGPRLFAADGPGSALHAGTGLACLFSGPPGTGKTMAAQIVARQVDRALFRIDLSQVVNKYIGESEKRLAKVFDAAERAQVALFFDEADALFGKRTDIKDSHDRYANITVDYLLQRLEGFDGLSILATNFAGNIDDAVLRRVRIRAEFPAPKSGDRRTIWDKLLPPPEQRAEDIDIPRLADPYDLVGREIRNAIYTAHLLAASDDSPLGMRHCVRGLWRELSKIGRVPDRAHLGPWAAVVEDMTAA